jgi:hypothetical protein
MKSNNLIALTLGLICAGLLWQYYLYPKYAKKVQDPQTMSDLFAADKASMDEELANIPGELVFRSDEVPKPDPDNATISYVEDPTIEKETISIIKAPAKYELIKTAEEYKKIKNLLASDLGPINFSKEMLILVESDGNLNDGFFQIKKVQNTGEQIIVSYSFNIIGAKDRVGKISAQKVDKSDLPIVLQQK